jgi:hypothetical protein
MINHTHIPTGKQSLSNTSENKSRFGGWGGVVGVGKPSLPFTQFFMKTILAIMRIKMFICGTWNIRQIFTPQNLGN